MSLKTEFEKLKYDVRMQDINLSSKMIKAEEIKSHLASLEDSSANATKVSVDEPVDDDLDGSMGANEDTSAGEGFQPSGVQGQPSSDFSNQQQDYNPYSSDNN